MRAPAGVTTPVYRLSPEKLKAKGMWQANAARQGQSHCGPVSQLALLCPHCRKVPLFGLEAIWRSGQVVGHVRRADFGFALDKSIAYGYVREPSGGPVSPVRQPCPGNHGSSPPHEAPAQGPGLSPAPLPRVPSPASGSVSTNRPRL